MNARLTGLLAPLAGLLAPLAAVLLALAAGGVLIAAVGQSPLEVYTLLVRQALGTGYGVGQTLFKATPPARHSFLRPVILWA